MLTGSGSSSACITLTSTTANISYSCSSGTLINGDQCLLGNQVTVPANASYSCNAPATLNSSGNGCVTSTTSSPDITYQCPSGQSVSGSLCMVKGVASAAPHAVSFVQYSSGPPGNRAYRYDARGNRISEAWESGTTATASRSYVYTSYNMPSAFSATAGSSTVSESYLYGPDHQRIKQVSTDLGTIYYVNPDKLGGLYFEKQTNSAVGTVLRNYVTVAGVVVALIEQTTSPTGAVSEQTRYYHRDNLGSVNLITDESGKVVGRLAYEPFGKRRFPSGTEDPNSTIQGVVGQRGFTNHEHMDELTLVNMNGRVYDPMTGRFLSADPFIQAPYNSQSYNRYSYLFNCLAHPGACNKSDIPR